MSNGQYPESRRHSRRTERTASTSPLQSAARNENTASRRRKTLSSVLAVTALVVLLLIGGWIAYSYFTVADNLAPAAVTSKQLGEVLDQPVPERATEPEYVLILGADRRPGQSRARSDTILIARIDRAKREVSMLSIPRDSRVAISGHGHDKITHANAFGGPALAVSTVKEYTGLPIHHFVEIDFAGFADVVDSLGGVTLDVDAPIDDKHGSDTGGVSGVTHISAGRQVLSGAEALTFVRSRAFSDGDFTRIRHQQQFLKALASQALAGENLPRLPGVIRTVSANIDTDLSVAELLSLASDFRGFDGESMKSVTLPGTPKRINGVSYVVSDEAEVRRIAQAFATGMSPQP